MKAIVYTKYGSPNVLQLKEVDKPVPKDNEVLIKVHAAEATKTDCELRSFNFPVKWFWLPLRIAMGIIKPKRQILGGYFAGEVVLTGSGVSKFTKGDLVFGTTKLRNDEQQSVFYKKVLDRIDEIYGKQQARNPISTGRLKLQATLGRMNIEMRVKQGKFALWYLIENWLITLFGKLYFRYDKGGKYYLKRLVELSDTLTIDGKISTVITGTVQQRELLIASLNQMEQAGEIIFGWHTNKESVISCYVRDRIDQHIHFVDGSEGGYTRAAGMLKKKALKLANLPMS